MKKLSVLIIIVGVMIFSVPIIGQMVTNYLETTMITAWQNGTDVENNKVYTTVYSVYNGIVDFFNVEKQAEDNFTSDLEQQEELANVNEFGETPKSTNDMNTPSASQTTAGGVAQKPHATAKPKTVIKRKKQKVIGIIKIPKIKVNLPIVEGVEKQNLRVGIGHFPGTTQLGGQGNTALAGHRSYALGKMFNRLDEVVNGDDITIITKKGSYTYKVYQKLVVLPKDVYVLNNVKNDNIITLVTCTPVRIATHRLIVKARLVK